MNWLSTYRGRFRHSAGAVYEAVSSVILLDFTRSASNQVHPSSDRPDSGLIK